MICVWLCHIMKLVHATWQGVNYHIFSSSNKVTTKWSCHHDICDICQVCVYSECMENNEIPDCSCHHCPGNVMVDTLTFESLYKSLIHLFCSHALKHFLKQVYFTDSIDFELLHWFVYHVGNVWFEKYTVCSSLCVIYFVCDFAWETGNRVWNHWYFSCSIIHPPCKHVQCKIIQLTQIMSSLSMHYTLLEFHKAKTVRKKQHFLIYCSKRVMRCDNQHWLVAGFGQLPDKWQDDKTVSSLSRLVQCLAGHGDYSMVMWISSEGIFKRWIHGGNITATYLCLCHIAHVT